MNIALVGAPGSGKSKLAEELAQKLSAGVVDNYVQEIEQETNIAIGSIIDYVGNLCVILGRYGRERVAREKYEHVITCGTLMESAIYYAAHVLAFRETSTPEQQAEYAPRVDASIRIMACFYADLLSYDHIFYLPYKGADENSQFVDQQLQVAVAGFKLHEIVVLEENPVQGALEVIGEVQNT